MSKSYASNQMDISWKETVSPGRNVNGLSERSPGNAVLEDRLKSLEAQFTVLGEKHAALTTLNKEIVGNNIEQAKRFDDLSRDIRARDQEMQAMRQSIQEVQDRGSRASIEQTKRLDDILREQRSRDQEMQVIRKSVQEVRSTRSKEDRITELLPTIRDYNSLDQCLREADVKLLREQGKRLDDMSREERARDGVIKSMRQSIQELQDARANIELVKRLEDISREQLARNQEMQAMRQSIEEVRDRDSRASIDQAKRLDDILREQRARDQEMQIVRQSITEMRDMLDKERGARKSIETICTSLQKQVALDGRHQYFESLFSDLGNKYESLRKEFAGNSSAYRMLIDSISREQCNREKDVGSLRDLIASSRNQSTSNEYVLLEKQVNYLESLVSDVSVKYATLRDDVVAFMTDVQQTMLQEQRNREAHVNSVTQLLASYRSPVVREDYEAFEKKTQGHLELFRQELARLTDFIDAITPRLKLIEEGLAKEHEIQEDKCAMLALGIQQIEEKFGQIDSELLQQRNAEKKDVGQMIDILCSSGRQIEAIASSATTSPTAPTAMWPGVSSPSSQQAAPVGVIGSQPLEQKNMGKDTVGLLNMLSSSARQIEAITSPATTSTTASPIHRPLGSFQGQHVSSPLSQQTSPGSFIANSLGRARHAEGAQFPSTASFVSSPPRQRSGLS